MVTIYKYQRMLKECACLFYSDLSLGAAQVSGLLGLCAAGDPGRNFKLFTFDNFVLKPRLSLLNQRCKIFCARSLIW